MHAYKVGPVPAIAIISVIALFLAGPCLTTGPPASNITPEQIALVRQSFDAVQEEVAAARSPSKWPFALFLLSITLPLVGAIWVLFRAEQSAMGFDSEIRWLVRAGMAPSLIESYLKQADGYLLQGQKRPGFALPDQRRIVTQRRRWHPRRRKAWRRRRLR